MMDGPDDFIGPVNLGNPDEFTIRELAEIGAGADRLEVEDRASSRCRPTTRPMRSPTSPWRESISTGNRQVPLREGLAKTIDWFRSIDLAALSPADAEFLEQWLVVSGQTMPVTRNARLDERRFGV